MTTLAKLINVLILYQCDTRPGVFIILLISFEHEADIPGAFISGKSTGYEIYLKVRTILILDLLIDLLMSTIQSEPYK